MVCKMKRNLVLLVVGGAALVLGINLLHPNPLTDKRELRNKDSSLLGKHYTNNTSKSENFGAKRNIQGQKGQVAKPSAEASHVIAHVNETILGMIREIREKMISVDVSVKHFDIACGQKSIDKTEDLLCLDPPKIDPTYKNPCWPDHGRLQCLPYFQVIGMDKCGSTDLFDKIAQHPDVVNNGGTLGKETLWWSWVRYGHWLKRPTKKKTFKDYLNYFQTAAKRIQKEPKRNFITGDGTPMDLWDNTGWRSIPQNNGLREPRYITPHLIKHINPNVKFLVILRDPIERLFSDYFFLQLGKMTIEGFHNEVVRSIKLLHTCTRTSSLRACLYSRNLHLATNARIALGFYATFLQDWFQVFPRNQFLILRTEDFASSTLDTMYTVFKFLDLRELPAGKMHSIATSKRKYVTKKKKMVGKMKPETRRILEELYGNFNQQLATLLKDRKFTWK